MALVTDSRISEVPLQLGLNGDAELSSLSGGWLRKAVLGRALVSSPRVLLSTNRPTTRISKPSTGWRGFLKEFDGSIVFISHDRSFIRNMATRIVDLIAALVSPPGNYDLYRRAKKKRCGWKS